MSTENIYINAFLCQIMLMFVYTLYLELFMFNFPFCFNEQLDE